MNHSVEFKACQYPICPSLKSEGLSFQQVVLLNIAALIALVIVAKIYLSIK